jgi:hypothetical protein
LSSNLGEEVDVEINLEGIILSSGSLLKEAVMQNGAFCVRLML